MTKKPSKMMQPGIYTSPTGRVYQILDGGKAKYLGTKDEICKSKPKS